MKLRLSGIVVGASLLSAPATAGGLYLPGAGAVSTSRAGAAVSSTSDGEALAINPAGFASAGSGTMITISLAMIQYAMQFTRDGTYDDIPETTQPYEGTAYPTVKNDPKPPLGIGKMQPVPVIAVVSDLGGAVPGLHVAAGIYAPNAYPFRDMSQGYVFNLNYDKAPPPTRYDILTQDAAVLAPSIAASYRANKIVDVGARFSWGIANLHSKTTVWGVAGNYNEWIERDATIDLEAKDNFVPMFGLGVQLHPTPELDIGINYSSAGNIRAKGTAKAVQGREVKLGPDDIQIRPTDGTQFKTHCESGGTDEAQKACVGLDLPMQASLGARYKFLDAKGKFRGDVELQLDWQNWAADYASNYHVVVDGVAFVNGEETLDLKESIIHHGLQDTYAARLGGSYVIPLDEQRADSLVLRGGVGYDTAAAKSGWLRADLDGAARTTFALGVGYKAKTWEANIGGGFIYEGKPTNGGHCNPTGTISPADQGCDGSGQATPVGDDRGGVDPTNPAVADKQQAQSPVNRGVYESSYLLLMLGFTKSF